MLGCKGISLVQTLNERKKEKCKTSSGLLEVLNKKIQFSILLLKYCKLVRVEKGSAEKWMACLRVNTNECK